MTTTSLTRRTFNGYIFEVTPKGTLKISADDSARADLRWRRDEKGWAAVWQTHLVPIALEVGLELFVTDTDLLGFGEVDVDIRRRDEVVRDLPGGRKWVFTETRNVDAVERLIGTGVVRFSLSPEPYVRDPAPAPAPTAP